MSRLYILETRTYLFRDDPKSPKGLTAVIMTRKPKPSGATSQANETSNEQQPSQGDDEICIYIMKRTDLGF